MAAISGKEIQYDYGEKNILCKYCPACGSELTVNYIDVSYSISYESLDLISIGSKTPVKSAFYNTEVEVNFTCPISNSDNPKACVICGSSQKPSNVKKQKVALQLLQKSKRKFSL